MNKKQIEQFVNKWMSGHEPDTFIKNKDEIYLYHSEGGRSGINLKLFFEDLLEDYQSEISLPEIIQEKDREIKSLTANKNILERINQQDGELLAEIAKESNEKDTQIQELKEDVMGFAEWVDKLSITQRVTAHPPAGSGAGHGIYELSTEQLYANYLSTKK